MVSGPHLRVGEIRLLGDPPHLERVWQLLSGAFHAGDDHSDYFASAELPNPFWGHNFVE